VKFETSRISEALDFIEAKGLHRYSGKNGPSEMRVLATGGGAYRFGDAFKERLGLSLEKEDEMDCLVRARLQPAPAACSLRQHMCWRNAPVAVQSMCCRNVQVALERSSLGAPGRTLRTAAPTCGRRRAAAARHKHGAARHENECRSRGAEQHDAAQHGATQQGMARRGMAQRSATQHPHGTPQHGAARRGMV
jgi:hypothetical protein